MSTWLKRDTPRSKGGSTNSPPVTLESYWTKRDPQPHQAQQAHQGHISVTFWLAQNVTLASPKRDSNVTPQQASKLKPSLSKVTFGPSFRLGPNMTFLSQGP
ncbi:hypothetical protein PIB30_033255 [Stylosanthes scabra]|uniref:Uncharacterized protein n=1 Tax=Stylosanthes scabra TaxID=79078 RepID=A0ABU6YCU2_9FABA|nr:hypothetical protein [Stylosanthes scabra]